MVEDSCYLEAHDKLANYLNILFKFSEISDKLDTKKNLKKIITDGLLFFKFLISKTGKSNTTYTEFLSKYKSLFNVEKEEDIGNEEFVFENETELTDHLNYTKVAAKNAFNLDLETVNLEELSKQSSEPAKEYPKSKDSFVVYKNFLNADFFPQKGLEDPEKYIGDLILKSHAMERLNRDILDGSIYIYRTRPKRNVHIKYLLIGLLLVGVLLSLGVLGTVLTSLFKERSTDIFSQMFVTSMVSFFYFLFIIFSFFKNLGNDNFKYAFNKKEFYHTLALALVFSLLAGARPSGSSSFTADATAIAVLALIIALFVLILAICSIYFFSYMYLNPPKDEKLISERIYKHMENLSEDL